MDIPGLSYRNYLLCNVKCTSESSGYSQQRNIFVKQDVKLTEPPDAEPHVRWCERSAAKAASYSIYIDLVLICDWQTI